ncbi:MAG: hypothetical protein H0X51_01590 [Parachlamydiaceae bacterium]|nr:hypothetical protein [Parachlamydiaceae bacterium]
MLEIPVNNIQIVQEYTVIESEMSQISNNALYQMSEVDLSFSDALAGMCSGESSSGPVNRPTTGRLKQTNV